MKNCWPEAVFMQSCGIRSRALKITEIPQGYTWMAILPAQKAENTDRIHISPEASRQLEVEQLSRSILSEIREPASQERLESLRSAIQKGTYNVPTGELVDAVIRHFVA